MGGQSEQFYEVFAQLRDHGKPNTQKEAQALTEARAPMPPSKAHLKRLARHAANVRFVQPVPAAREVTPETLALRKQLEFQKAMLAQMGGTRTVAPDPVSRPKGVYVNWENSQLNSELGYKSDRDKRQEEQAQLDRQIDRMRRDHVDAMANRYATSEYQPDLFR